MTEEMLQEVRDLKRVADSDNIKFKQIIVDTLWQDPRIIHFINSTLLDESCPDEYIGTHIRKYYAIPEVQTSPENYIFVTCHYNEMPRYNSIEKYMQVTFQILCDVRTIEEEETGISRHDLLGAIILDIFNYSNIFGMQIHCISDQEGITDNEYVTRTLIFESTTTNNILQTRNKVTKVINREPVRQ